MKVRTLLIASLAALLIPLMVGGIFVLGVATQIPANGQSRIEGPHGVYGVAATSYAWVVPVGKSQVVIVDAGQDIAAGALTTEVGGRDVLGILLTHAHADTSAGVDAFPDAPVYLGPGERTLLTGESEAQGWMSAWLARSLPRPRLPEVVTEVEDGQVVELGSARFHAVHMPGHTAGSVAWVWRDVAFVGDAVLVQPRVMTMMAAFSDDEEQAHESVGNLLPVDFAFAVDARGGVLSDARAALGRFVGQELEDPTVRVRDAADTFEAPQVDLGEPVVMHGVVRVDPRRFSRDSATPPELVTDDGRVYRLPPSDGLPADGSWNRLLNRPVTVRGRPAVPALGSAVDPRPILKVEELEVDEDATASTGPVERSEPEDWRRGQWVEWVGRVERIEPLSPGASWGEVAVGAVGGAMPVRLVQGRLGEVVTVLGVVVRGGSDARISARVVCAGDRPGCGVRVPGIDPDAELAEASVP